MTTIRTGPGGRTEAPENGSDELADETTAVRRAVKCCPECAQHYSSDSMFCPFDGTALEEMIWVAPTDPSVDPLLGITIDGRYRVIRVLGEGGTGTVYEVMHESLGRRFAMKVLRRDVAKDPTLAARFIQEARATASLKHPHIVSITDFGLLVEKIPYFVMERLYGQTLAHVCKVGGQLPASRAINVVLQVAGALAVAHEAGIVHRDLKPENLFLVGRIDGEGEGGDDVRVVDFGAAKIAGASRITKTGIVFGTPHYMAPEQASGQPVDHRADIYALGVIMYEIFSGRLPFEADTLMGVLTKHMFVEPPPFGVPSIADSDTAQLLGALEAVTLRAMAKKPEHRFQTMAALAAELERTVSFNETGGVALSPEWQPQPRRRPARPLGELARELEGPERAGLYPSDDVPLVPRTSWRPVAIVGVLVGMLAVAIGTLSFGRGRAVSVDPATVAPAAPSIGAPPSSGASPPVPPPGPGSRGFIPPVPTLASIHLTTSPPFAEVWREGHRIGTAPMDLPLDTNGHLPPCTIRAPGYLERPLLIDDPAKPSIDVALERVATIATPPSVPKAHKAHGDTPPPPSTHARQGDGELVDPFTR
jgi:serine/threonine protein kinase